MKQCLALPELSGIDLDDPAATQRRIEVVQRKAFLRNLYREWYRMLRAASQEVPGGPRLELGSGPGFIKEFIPQVITSDLLEVSTANLRCSAERLPFADRSIAALYLVDVLHHLSSPRAFFAEAERCIMNEGGIFMIEPCNTIWGNFVWSHFHHEPFDTQAGWELEEAGPLSGANGALPWIVFNRDRTEFERHYPALEIMRIKPFMPVSYLLSGGVSMRAFLPGWCYRPVRILEGALGPLNHITGMYSIICLRRR